MTGGIRATVAFPEPPVCPIACAADETDSVVDTVANSVSPDEAPSVTEFPLSATAVPDDVDADRVISYGHTTVFRYTHGDDVDCPCECLGQFGCPVDRYFAREGRLTLAFHAADFAELQEVVAALREHFTSVDIRRLVRSPDEEEPTDAVFVDRGKLTDRQLEVLRTAYEMGYFKRPRQANATDIAAELDISASTLAEHLASAQTKLVGDVLEEGDQ